MSELPVARRDGLIVQRLGEEALVYDTERDQAHCLAPLAARVFDLCDGRRSPAEIAALAAVSTDAVALALRELDQLDLLAAPIVSLHAHSRREVIRKVTIAGAAAAGAAPLIKTIVAPTPALAQTVAACPNQPGGATTCTAGQFCCTGTANNQCCPTGSTCCSGGLLGVCAPAGFTCCTGGPGPITLPCPPGSTCCTQGIIPGCCTAGQTCTATGCV